LLSLFGLGGVGKTTVAMVLARRLRSRGKAVLFVRAEHASDADTALQAACDLTSSGAGESPVGAFTQSLSADSVLIFDNVEQIGDLGETLVRLLDDTPASFVVTSRSPLDVAHEVAVHVPPLPVNGSTEAPGPAVEMFLERMAVVRGRTASADDVAAATNVCNLCGGIPLAIGIAADHTRSITARRLADRLSGHPELVVTTQARFGVPERQRSLAIVLDDAIRHLGHGPRAVLGVVCSVTGYISVELLARTVERVDGADVFNDIDGLVRVDLVRVDDDGRVVALPPVREFVNSTDDSAEHSELLVDGVVALATEVGPRLVGCEQARSVDLLRLDDDALRAALSIAVRRTNIDAAVAILRGIHRYWLLTGRLADARHWLTEIQRVTPGDATIASVAVELLAGTFASYVNDPRTDEILTSALRRAAEMAFAPDRVHVNAWCCLAAFRVSHGNVDLANEAAARAAALASSSGDRSLVALARDLSGFVAAHSGQWESCLELMLQAIADARLDGDPADLVHTLCTAAEALERLDQPENAWEMLEEASAVSRGLAPGPVVISLIMHRGQVLTALNRPAAARGCLLEALHLQRNVYPDPIAVADVLYMLAATFADTDRNLAARVWGASHAIYTDHGIEPGTRSARRFAAAQREAQSSDPRRFEVQFNLGMSDPDRTIDRLAAHRDAGVTRSS
jgi:predicted ATPase